MGADALRLRLRLRLTDLTDLTDPTANQQGDPRAVVGEFRRSEVLVPVVDETMLSVEAGGIRWLFAFTDDAALERFARARGEAVPERVPVFGARLLDQVIPRVASRTGGPTGIAVDAGSPAGLVLPPVRGVVPDEVAVDGVGLAS